MVSAPTPLKPYLKPTPGVYFSLTAGILFISGLAHSYQGHTRAIYENTFTLSAFEWIGYSVLPFLIEPVLLFGVLFFVQSRRKPTLSLTQLLPGLFVVVVVGGFSGLFVGARIWGNGAANTQYWMYATGYLWVIEAFSVRAWVSFLEPFFREFLTAVAALGLARTVQFERRNW
ncbi:hypothetical protein [Haloferax sp. DFSO60]|uniref:hypothetical protein n=1 Tax=Haloferax sp. DFSO60 TaxID=3388652 RepID=UPI00397E17B2